MITRAGSLLKSVEGVTTVDYAVMFALILVAAIAIIGALGGGVGRTFGITSERLPT